MWELGIIRVSKLHVKGGVELNDLTASNGAENEAK